MFEFVPRITSRVYKLIIEKLYILYIYVLFIQCVTEIYDGISYLSPYVSFVVCFCYTLYTTKYKVLLKRDEL